MRWPSTREAFAMNAPRGIRVFLRRDTWDHICDGHAEMQNRLDDVLQTGERPDEVYNSQKHRYSFRYFDRRGNYIMIIYKVVGAIGWVKTAYIVPNPYLEVEGYNRVWPIT